MDDGLVLNLDFDASGGSKKGSAKKGGSWTQRVKAKRVEKRKTRNEVPSTSTAAALTGHDREPEARPNKRPRTDGTSRPSGAPAPASTPSASTNRAPKQIISSLFSYNPRIEKEEPAPAPKKASKPSNAPRTDSSSFAGLGLDPLLASHLSSKLGIEKPTSIQCSTIPALLAPQDADNASLRDAFIQSQTGSGKTLSYLLPIINDLLPLSEHSYIDRSIGTLAIIIAPTRELAKQISDVVEELLKLRLRPKEELPDDESGTGRMMTRWLVSGLLTGGATRAHEKARLRKGVPILVSTPGRLLDHLQNTSSFNVGKCRWLVLDEADRLMELGFEDTIKGILSGLDGRRKLAKQAVEEGNSMEVGGWDWERRRRTLLCSATMREDVQILAGHTLQAPLMIRATEADVPQSVGDNATEAVKAAAQASGDKFTPPSQLTQKYVVVPLKLRLVTLIALLRTLLSQAQSKRGSKIIVFLSCTDSVDFHWKLLASAAMDSNSDDDEVSDSDAEASDKAEESTPKRERVAVTSDLLPDASIFRLHGSLPTATRLASLRAFSATPKDDSPSSSILLCTSVASRGLDLPLLRAVIQYDLPTEGGATEYVHRVGRTARAGKGGEAWAIVAPSENAWVPWVEERMAKDGSIRLTSVAAENLLQSGFGGKGKEFEMRATEVQLTFERWALRQDNAALARQAFSSHMRAYATHPSDEKHIFHIRHLHLGHLAKAFALREAPSNLKSANPKSKTNTKFKATRPKGKGYTAKGDGFDDDPEAEKRMRTAVRAQGRLSKKGGVLMDSGVGEFQVASTDALEKLVNAAF